MLQSKDVNMGRQRFAKATNIHQKSVQTVYKQLYLPVKSAANTNRKNITPQA